jgi:hypothetical protein
MWAQFRPHLLLWIAPNEGLQQQAHLGFALQGIE